MAHYCQLVRVYQIKLVIFPYYNNVKKCYRYVIIKKAERNDDVTISTSWETTTATPSSLSFYMKPEEELGINTILSGKLIIFFFFFPTIIFYFQNMVYFILKANQS